ncbi:MAG: glycosyltransferase family 2 protein [Desulfofustis sp.]|nr:glycosyltransferase family 2 protein [Desulfofustis sp.]
MSDISVIIPTYNRSKRLIKALESVARQRLLPTEVIVIDDGSTDETRQLVNSFSNLSPLNLHYHYQSNRGPAAARNRGIEIASGDYLAFLDSDDEWRRDKLANQYEVLYANPHYFVSHTQERWFKNGTHLNQKKYHYPRHGDIFSQALKLCCVGMSTVMTRRELFDRYGLFDQTLRCCEDYDLWLRVAAFEMFFLVEQQLTIKHGGRPDQVSNYFRVGMDRFRIQALAKLVRDTSVPQDRRDAACQELIHRCTVYGLGCAKHRKQSEASFYLELAEHCRTHLEHQIQGEKE